MWGQPDRDKETHGEWKQLVQGREPLQIERGSILYTPNHAADALLLLTSGRVGLHLPGPEKRTLLLRELEPGALLGHAAITGDEHYDTVAEALTSARVYRIVRAELDQEIKSNPSLALALLDDIGQHRAIISHRLDEVAFKSVPARLASLLLDMAEGEDDPTTARVPRRSHRQLAEMINAYRETVTKVINQFRAAHLLDIDRYTITLLNRTRLEELAQGW